MEGIFSLLLGLITLGGVTIGDTDVAHRAESKMFGMPYVLVLKYSTHEYPTFDRCAEVRDAVNGFDRPDIIGREPRCLAKGLPLASQPAGY